MNTQSLIDILDDLDLNNDYFNMVESQGADDYCASCGAEWSFLTSPQHTDKCPVTRLRTLYGELLGSE